MIQDNKEMPPDSEADEKQTETNGDKKKVTIEFPYSDVVRAQIPKAFETAETLATEVTHQWKTDGDFKNIGLPHPLADMVASQALQKAKQIEKKLEEKGVLSLAKLGFEAAKSQFESLKKKI